MRTEDLDRIHRAAPGEAVVGVILGSGLGSFVDRLEQPVAIPYRDLPGFPASTVAGHSGRLVRGSVSGVPVVVQQGRFHLYEGYSAFQVAYPVRVMHALGARILVVTNASGGLHVSWAPGTLMVIRDHINFQFRSALRGRGAWVDDTRFVDLAEPYTSRLVDRACETAQALGLLLKHGTYWGNLGPAYETPAEVAMCRRLGADAVGMSTVPEVITAVHCGMEVLGLSCIANTASGLKAGRLSHAEVLEAVRGAEGNIAMFLDRLIPAII